MSDQEERLNALEKNFDTSALTNHANHVDSETKIIFLTVLMMLAIYATWGVSQAGSWWLDKGSRTSSVIATIIGLLGTRVIIFFMRGYWRNFQKIRSSLWAIVAILGITTSIIIWIKYFNFFLSFHQNLIGDTLYSQVLGFINLVNFFISLAPITVPYLVALQRLTSNGVHRQA